MSKLTTYFKEAIQEIKKVTWPTKKEAYNYTLLVIAISVIVAAFLGGLDYIFNLLLQTLLNN